MAELKTRPTEVSVDRFLEKISDPVKQADARAVITMMKQATREQPRMWGSAIIGFGSQMLTYASGRQLDWPVIAFSPRKPSLVLYGSWLDQPDLMKKLGPHKTGKGCLYIRRLDDVDAKVLKELITVSVRSKGDSDGSPAAKSKKRPAAKKKAARR